MYCHNTCLLHCHVCCRLIRHADWRHTAQAEERDWRPERVWMEGESGDAEREGVFFYYYWRYASILHRC